MSLSQCTCNLHSSSVPAQPASGAAERVFSLLNSSFGERQEMALEDYIEASIMLQYNNR